MRKRKIHPSDVRSPRMQHCINNYYNISVHYIVGLKSSQPYSKSFSSSCHLSTAGLCQKNEREIQTWKIWLSQNTTDWATLRFYHAEAMALDKKCFLLRLRRLLYAHQRPARPRRRTRLRVHFSILFCVIIRVRAARCERKDLFNSRSLQSSVKCALRALG
jgi:hypothetical protein